MGLLTVLVVASGLVLAGRSAHRGAPRRQPKPLPLVNLLIDGTATAPILLPPAQRNGPVTRVQKLTQDLFGDTRQQYQQALSTTAAVDGAQRAAHDYRLDLPQLEDAEYKVG